MRGVQHPLARVELGQRLPGERGRAFGVPAELSQVTAVQRDVRGNVHQQAAGLADRGLERLLTQRWRRPARPLPAAAPPRPGARWWRSPASWASSNRGRDQTRSWGRRRKPPLDRRSLTAEAVDRVEMPLDEPGGLEHLARGGRMPDRVVSQPVLFVPGRGALVQLRGLTGLLVQPGPEQIREQVVVTPPAAYLIEGSPGTARPARSAPAAPGCPGRPVTASHSAPLSRSSTEVSSSERVQPAQAAAPGPPRPGSPERSGDCR